MLSAGIQLKEFAYERCAIRIRNLCFATTLVEIANWRSEWIQPLLQTTVDAFDGLLAKVANVVRCNDGLDIGRQTATTRMKVEALCRKVDINTRISEFTNFAQSAKLRAERSILCMTTPLARFWRSCLIMVLKMGRPFFAAVSFSSNHLVISMSLRSAKAQIASLCASSDTPSPCLIVDTREYAKHCFIVLFKTSPTLPHLLNLSNLAKGKSHYAPCAHRCVGTVLSIA